MIIKKKIHPVFTILLFNYLPLYKYSFFSQNANTTFIQSPPLLFFLIRTLLINIKIKITVLKNFEKNILYCNKKIQNL